LTADNFKTDNATETKSDVHIDASAVEVTEQNLLWSSHIESVLTEYQLRNDRANNETVGYDVGSEVPIGETTEQDMQVNGLESRSIASDLALLPIIDANGESTELHLTTEVAELLNKEPNSAINDESSDFDLQANVVKCTSTELHLEAANDQMGSDEQTSNFNSGDSTRESTILNYQVEDTSAELDVQIKSPDFEAYADATNSAACELSQTPAVHASSADEESFDQGLSAELKFDFSGADFDAENFPSHFSCSFAAFGESFSLYFRYRSFAFSENTPVYTWNGSFAEKRIVGKVPSGFKSPIFIEI
jgi:hypothetical protein